MKYVNKINHTYPRLFYRCLQSNPLDSVYIDLDAAMICVLKIFLRQTVYYEEFTRDQIWRIKEKTTVLDAKNCFSRRRV